MIEENKKPERLIELEELMRKIGEDNMTDE
jgi:hypothetical protein